MDILPHPNMGLQFNPTQGHGQGTLNGESQEIIVDSTGAAVVVGDVESDNGRHPSASQGSKGGILPIWLSSSSPKMKGLLGTIAVVFLVFVSVMIVGVLQSPSAVSMESDQNKVTDPDESLPTPGPAPNDPSSTSTDPVAISEVKILLSDFLEAKIPNFTDGLTSAELENWSLVEDHIESAITASLLDNLPEGFSVESLQIDKFDGFAIPGVGNRKRTRRVQENLDKIHIVLYSSSVTADCTVADCSAALDKVTGVTSEMSKLEFLQVFAGTDAPTESPLTFTLAPAISTLAPAISTLAPAISTIAPTKLDTTPPTTVSPTSSSPTEILILSDRENDCTDDEPCGKCTGEEPCGKCLGACISDDSCEEGLFCFQRIGYEPIPGCVGPGIPAQSYCYDPFATGLNVSDLLAVDEGNACDRKTPCEKCGGGCFQNEDCIEGLFCYYRLGFEPVPGCAGQGMYGSHYCFDPADLVSS
jgi:hypothetical protein